MCFAGLASGSETENCNAPRKWVDGKTDVGTGAISILLSPCRQRVMQQQSYLRVPHSVTLCLSIAQGSIVHL